MRGVLLAVLMFFGVGCASTQASKREDGPSFTVRFVEPRDQSSRLLACERMPQGDEILCTDLNRFLEWVTKYGQPIPEKQL